MRVHETEPFQHRKGGMTVATIEQAREVARSLERRERGRAGNLDAARASLARRVGVSPSTWRNLALGRLKRLDAWLRDSLQHLLIRELELEIARLEHELEIARRSGAHLASHDVSEIETHLARARAILEPKFPAFK
jgi:hypothetical protein